jgi:hypothetical protein
MAGEGEAGACAKTGAGAKKRAKAVKKALKDAGGLLLG